ncbi:MAG: hypothetical protein ACLPWD_05575 [Methanobacterium sp.]
MRFHPVISIIIGLIVAITLAVLLKLILGLNSPFFGVMNFQIGVTIFALGAFITTFLAKEDKIEYGIYFTVILLTIYIIAELFNDTNIYNSYYVQTGVFIGTIVGYVFSALVGSYLGITIQEQLQKNTEKNLEKN